MAEDTQYRDWQAPPREAPEDRRIGWLNESVEEGQVWLSSQRGDKDHRRALDIVSGRTDNQGLVDYRSRLNTNRLKTNIRTATSGLSAIRPIWGYHSRVFSEQATMFNKTARALYFMNHWSLAIEEWLQYAAATKTGWIRPIYEREPNGKASMQLMTYGAPCVLPVQLPSNGNFQRAYAVTLMDEKPIWEAHWKFPDYQDKLRPTASRYWHSMDIRRAAEKNLWKRMFNRGKSDGQMTEYLIPIRYTTINDLSVNNTGQMIPMGQWGSPWYYEVPSFGADIPAGRDEFGNPVFRKANATDARLYPNRRLMISSENCIMYDGPNFNWHGELDLINLSTDSWPWEPLGFSMIQGGAEIQSSINEIERGVMDKVRAAMDPALAYAMDAVPKRQADEFDPMQPRARLAYDANLVEKPFQSPVPEEFYRVQPEWVAFRDSLKEDMDYQLQIRDVVELSKARALAAKGMDDVEALVAANGPIVKQICARMESKLAVMGNQIKYLILEYMDTATMMQYIGVDETTQEIFDFDPNSIVPSHLPSEHPFTDSQSPQKATSTRLQRARWFADNLAFIIMPGSAHQLTQMTERLGLMQLRQRGAPISWATIMEAWEVPGTKEGDGSNEQEKFWAEKKEEIYHASQLQQIVNAYGIDAGLIPSNAGGNPNGTGMQGGRPPTAQAPPRLETKSDGRPVVSESG